MANTLVPNGFSEVGALDGMATTTGFAKRFISASYATQIFKGDPVVDNAGLIQQAAAGTTQIAGIFLGCEYQSVARQTKTFLPYWPAADAISGSLVLAKVIISPFAVFKVQANGQLLQSHVNKNVNFALGTGNTATGLSGATIDVSTIATTSTLPFRIVGLVDSPPGANGTDQTSPYSYALVTFNNQDFKSLTGL